MSAPGNSAAKARLTGVGIAATTILWLAVQVAGPRFGWGAGVALFFDFMALAAFVWALVMTYQIRRARRGE